jgi:hypothetical protein
MGSVDLENHDAPVREVPLAVRPALPPVAIAPWTLPDRRDDAAPAAGPSYIDLRH